MRLVDFGQRMKQYRGKHNLTQEKLAEKLCVQTKHISLLENGHRNPSPELQKKLEDMIIADQLRSTLSSPNRPLTEEELIIQLRLFHKLSRLNSSQREKVLNVIYELLDAMGKNR